MDPVKNPFTPNAGAEPPAIVGRDAEMATFDLLLRAKLIEMGLLYTPQHGYAAFTVPHFDKYLRRAW